MPAITFQTVIDTLAVCECDARRNQVLRGFLPLLPQGSVTSSQLCTLLGVYQAGGKVKAIKILFDCITELSVEEVDRIARSFQWGDLIAKVTALLTSKIRPTPTAPPPTSLTFDQFFSIISGDPTSRVVHRMIIYPVVKPCNKTDDELATKIASIITDIDLFRFTCCALHIDGSVIEHHAKATEDELFFITLENIRVDLRTLPTETRVTYDHGNDVVTSITRHADGSFDLKSKCGISELTVNGMRNRAHLVIKNGDIIPRLI